MPAPEHGASTGLSTRRRQPAAQQPYSLPPEVLQFQKAWHAEVVAKAERYLNRERHAEALELAAEAVKIAPSVASGWVTLGKAQMAIFDNSHAIGSFRKALSLQAGHAGAWSLLGEALRQTNRFAAADESHRRALSLRSDKAIFYLRWADNFISQGEDERALPFLNKALELDPTLARASWKRGECLRRFGVSFEGWQEYELRPGCAFIASPPKQKWTGEPFPRKTLLVRTAGSDAESIWAARFLPLAKARGGRLVLQCGKKLQNLLGGVREVDEVVGFNETPPDHDLSISIGSLAPIFTPNDSAVSGDKYLFPEPARLARFARWLGISEQKLRVGVCWSTEGMAQAVQAAHLSLESMVQAFALPGVQLYSLETISERSSREYCETSMANEVIFLGPYFDDLADAAAALSKLDVVITADCALAHLAGALGVTAWVFLDQPCSWLWGRRPDRTPWYNSAQLFRTGRPHDWNEQLDLATARLMALSGQNLNIFKSEL